jgi:hypothetical protein
MSSVIKPRENHSESEIRQLIAKAGLGSLLRRLFFKDRAKLARELGITEEQSDGLLSSRIGFNARTRRKIGKNIKTKP